MKSFFLGNGRLVMSRIGKVSSSMLISFIDSTPMIRSNVGFSLSSLYSTISSWSVFAYCDDIQRTEVPACLFPLCGKSHSTCTMFWHQPSRVGKTFGCSFPMEQKISVRATIKFILFSFGLLTFLLLVLDFVYLDLLEDFLLVDLTSSPLSQLQRLLHLISAEGSLRIVCIDEYMTQPSLWG